MAIASFPSLLFFCITWKLGARKGSWEVASQEYLAMLWGKKSTEQCIRQDRVAGTECTQLYASRLGFSYKKEGPKFMQRLVAKHKARVKDS